MTPILTKPLFLVFLCAFFSQILSAQEGKISGYIFDKATQKPLEYISVVSKQNDKIITGTITAKNGFYELNKLPIGKLVLEIRFMGLLPVTKEINLTKENSSIELPKIFMTVNTTELDEVTVTANNSSIIQKIDKKIVVVGKDLTATGTNAFEMFQNIPTVQVDFMAGTISFRGSNNVQILIDGKLSNLGAAQLLKSIPSNSIDRVELISNPSAKYTSEGMSGIINIILKKNVEKGFSGNVSAGVEHSKNTRPEINTNLNYRVGNVSLYTNMGLNWGDYETDYNLQRQDKNLNQFLDHVDKSTGFNIKLGSDFYINDDVLSIYTYQFFQNTDFITDGYLYENNQLIFRTPNISTYDYKQESYNIDYKFNFDKKGHALELEFNYSVNKNPEFSDNKELNDPSSKQYNFTNNITDTRKTWLANVDYSKPLSKGQVNFGLEARIDRTYNEIITDQEIQTTQNGPLTPRGNTRLNYDRNIYSAYAEYSGKSKKLSYQFGLRAEHFDVEGIFNNSVQRNLNNYSDKIFNIYPSAYLNYSFNDKKEIQVSYSRRVDRPGIDQITPIREFTSPYIISVGNQQLEPQYSNSYEINYAYNFKNGYINFGTFYRTVKNVIGRKIEIDQVNPDKQYITSDNFDKSVNFGIDISASTKLKNWWTLRPSIELYSQQSQGVAGTQQLSITNTLLNATLVNSLRLSKKLRFSLVALHRTTSKNVQFTVKPYTLLNASLRLSVLKNNGRITLRANDLLNSLDYKFSTTQPYPQIGSYVLEYNAVYLGFSYSFKSGKTKRRSRKERDANETYKDMF